MRKIREVLRLYFAAALSVRAIARSVCVSPSTVGDYLRRAEVAGLSRRGTVVLVAEPDTDAVELIDAGSADNFGHDVDSPEADDSADTGDGSDGGDDPQGRGGEIAAVADRTTRRLLAGPGGPRLVDLLRRASG